MMENDWYSFDNTSDIDSPSLLIYPDRVIDNIEALKNMVTSPSCLRPHVKTNKSANVCRLMIERGITKFKCATIAEAEMLAQTGAEDVLLAYQPTREKLNRFLKLQSAYPDTKFSCLVDNDRTAAMISAEAEAENVRVAVFIDLNVGMNRTGIHPEKALRLFEQLQKLPRISFKGLHAYDGHIEDKELTDRTEHCRREFI